MIDIGSKVVMINLKLDRRLRMAMWLITLAFTMAAVSLLIGIITQHNDVGITVAAAIISFVAAALKVLEWAYAG
jgi:hypothetical protein